MATKKPKDEVKPNLVSGQETKVVDEVTHKPLGGEEVKKKVKLKSKLVFEPMQGIHKTIWETVEE